MEAKTKDRRHRSRQSGPLLIGTCIIVGLVVGATGLLPARLHTRYTVIGPTDPATGIRIEYTVSSHYRREIDKEDPQSYKRDGFEDSSYFPKPPPTILRWYYAKLLHQPIESVWDLDERDVIEQTSSKHSDMPGMKVDNQGFPIIDLGHAHVMAAVDSQEPRLVYGCPTNLVIEDGDLVDNGHPNQYYDLLVRPRGQSIIYIFQATGVEGKSPNLALQELRAIRDSIRVVRTR